MSSVAKLYDNLFSLNSKRKENQTYPIHKSLIYEDENIKTLYHYLLAKYNIPKNGRLLDCGCGVGYGSLLLAKAHPQLEVHGISLSEKEIDLAKKQSQKQTFRDRCKFDIRSFDDLTANSYDCIIAIESLKHSPDIKKTMQVLTRALRSGGQLFIIEDVGKKDIDNFASQRQSNDWKLSKIFTVDDYHKVNGLTNQKVENMNHYLKTPNITSIIFRILFGELLVKLNSIGLKKNEGATIIRGGFYQEFLYATGKLDYLILTANKVS